MPEEMKDKEKAVFAQEASDEEMKQVNGGGCIGGPINCILTDVLDVTGISIVSYDCTSVYKRDIKEGGFPNCAATVESGSWCGSNDACDRVSVLYEGMIGCWFVDCHKAWE